MNIVSHLESGAIRAVKELYQHELEQGGLPITPTRKEFTGDYTIVTFPLTKVARKKPDEIAEELGAQMLTSIPEVKGFNVIKGFLNLELSAAFWNSFLRESVADVNYGRHPSNGKKVMVEFSSPNTNKPLHLGHIRNILLGWSSAQLLEAAGYEVVRVQVINDRGISICKSMLAWELFGNGETPDSSNTKGDHLVGKYYVEFEKKFQIEYAAWQESDEAKAVFQAQSKKEEQEIDFFKRYKNEYFNSYSKLGGAAKDMLLAWEAGDEDTVALWNQMNAWVYKGFDETYEALGVSFDKLYYESQTYLMGKALVEKGVEKGLFYSKEDGSVWVDLEDAGMDQKILLRSDGTSVYMTQDIGTARLRYDDYGVEQMVYVVADEQNYHFRVLFEILKRIGEPYAEGLHHLAYGMVDLTTGKMKSREGTIVDADDLIADVISAARENSAERGELDSLSAEERDGILRRLD